MEVAADTAVVKPVGQSTHVDAPAPENDPAWHVMQNVTLDAPGVEEARPAGQAVHDVDPGALEYLPTPQLVQVAAPDAEKAPAAHVVQVASPEAANVPAAHGAHVAELVAPTAGDAVPAAAPHPIGKFRKSDRFSNWKLQ